ncbi:MAG: hypothetical protein WCT53_00190 [Candidatus Gracilibacteria bacterium]
MKTCIKCQNQFQVEPEDLKFYAKMEVPEPTHCPRCRQQRRLIFRNEINLFHRKCDKTGKNIISMYSADSPYPIYDQGEWWKDNWDPIEYGRDFDFNRPFFEQFEELRRKVPRMSLNCIQNENSEYTSYALGDKNSYLLFTADFNEDCYYGRFSDRNFRCTDFDFTYDSKFCYQTIRVHNGTNCWFSQKLENCSDNLFCYDMKNCHSCIFCTNLRNQNYMILNKKVTQEEFEKFKSELNLSSRKSLNEAISKAKGFIQRQPHKYLENIQCEDCIGDYLKNCKNANYCFDSYDLQDTKYCSQVFKLKDCYDWDFVGENSELCYEMASSAGNAVHCRFCMNTWQGNSNMNYCDLCLFDSDCFGCVGLRRKKYCILNKQYSKEEYEALLPKVIDHMKKTGEWGEFFPLSLSPFAYNDSVAFEYFPLTKEQAIAQGLKWRDEDKKHAASQSVTVPDDIKDVKDDIVNAVLVCKHCEKNFKVVPQELKFYRELKLPIPEVCWVCRHHERMAQKNPRVVYQRNCSKCQEKIITTYSPEKLEPVYCEKCYLDFVA